MNFWLLGITMVEKRILACGLAVVLALGTLGFNWVEVILPPAEAHGVQAQLQSRFIRIEDETFNRQSLQTGETLMLQGNACQPSGKRSQRMDIDILRVY